MTQEAGSVASMHEVTQLREDGLSAPPLAGRAAIVTGGSRGIGRAIVERLAADGAVIVFSYATDSAAAEQVVVQVEAAGGRARAVQTDIGELEQVERLFGAAGEQLTQLGVDGLDILVNNAGIQASTPIERTTAEEYERVMAINARGAFFAIQNAARQMREGGRIVNVSTIGTAYPGAGEAVYAASKAAIEQFARVASRELAGRGITVNTVSPGPTDTDLLRGAAPPEALEGAVQMTALGRLGRPADVADLVAFLVGKDARWVTGQNIRADGGLV